MLLVADSGGTKTDWLLGDATHTQKFQTRGLNPNLVSEAEIRAVLQQHVLPHLQSFAAKTDIHFFGAGLASENTREWFGGILTEELSPRSCHVETDLLAATFATLGNFPGTIAILGTGSIACRYDGQKIIQNRGGWGYLLGDEGGGISLGKAWVRLFLGDNLPEDITVVYQQHIQMTKQQVIQKTYQHPIGSFLAQQAEFLQQHQQQPFVRNFLEEQFAEFFRETLLPCIQNPQEKTVFIGGIARNFFAIIQNLCVQHGIPQAECCFEPPIARLFQHLQTGSKQAL